MEDRIEITGNIVSLLLYNTISNYSWFSNFKLDSERDDMRWILTIKKHLNLFIIWNIRNELEKYLNDFKNKKGEDGLPIVYFPSNFDSIVGAMNRKDVLSSDKR